VLVPGGISPGSQSFGITGIADRFARIGFRVAHFDPDGRGESGGIEDFGGPVHQVGLAGVVRMAASDEAVDAARLAVLSFDAGALMATGAVARHPELSVRLLIDWEGPVTRADVAKVLVSGADGDAASLAGHDETWWREREPARWLPRVRVPYLRMQGDPDHAGLDPSRAVTAVRLAAASRFGGKGRAPWVRLNGDAPNCPSEPPDGRWLPAMPAEVAALSYLVELLPPR